tara:strand:- start:74 stop:274 length:201 start_codon:yes stop_codon:yes gene_type:complete
MEMNNPMWNTKILDIERENRIKERKAALYQKKKKKLYYEYEKNKKMKVYKWKTLRSTQKNVAVTNG